MRLSTHQVIESPLQPVSLARPPRLRDAAYNAIKEAILAGAFEPGHPLIEEQVAATLQISRTPVREAFLLLEHEQLVTCAPRHGRGIHVRQVTRVEFEEMFIANETVEPVLARRAAFRATDAHLAALDAAIDQGIAAATHDLPSYLQAGRRFHLALGLAAGNETLARFAERNEQRTDLYLLSYRSTIAFDRLDASLDEHRAIAEAMRRRDPDRTERLVVYHAQSVRHRLAPLFPQDQEASAG